MAFALMHPGSGSLPVNTKCGSTHTLPRLGLDAICINDQESEVAEDVMNAARVIVCRPEVVLEELIYLLHGAIEERLGRLFSRGHIGFDLLDGVRR